MINGEAKEYGPDLRDDYLFGYGQNCTFSPRSNKPEDIVSEALKLGWSNGCPRAKFYVLESTYGADWMMRRYAETNQWFRIALNLIRYRLHNIPILDTFAFYKERYTDEPVGIHEPLSVPESHKRRIAPMSAIEGYSIPRILLELGQDNNQTRVELLQKAVQLTGSKPWNFLAHLSATAMQMGADPIQILQHVYAQGVLDEENCQRAYVDLAQNLEQHAPDVWRIYCSLSPIQRQQLEIAEIPE